MTRLSWTTAGESHGLALVGLLSGMPAGLPLDLERVDAELARRQRGYGRGGRMRIERDRAELLAGTRVDRARERLRVKLGRQEFTVGFDDVSMYETL